MCFFTQNVGHQGPRFVKVYTHLFSDTLLLLLVSKLRSKAVYSKEENDSLLHMTGPDTLHIHIWDRGQVNRTAMGPGRFGETGLRHSPWRMVSVQSIYTTDTNGSSAAITVGQVNNTCAKTHI